MATISKGTTLSMVTYNASPSFSSGDVLSNLQEFGDLMGSPEAIDVTCLSNSQRVYTAGINDLGGQITFTFLWDKTVYNTVHAVEVSGARQSFQVKFADNVTVTFSGTVSTTILGKGVNEALQFQLNVCPDSDMVVAGLT